ncbi:MAG: hypothetical protein ACJ8G3_06445 [Burkholderiaceae bacterium]
MDTKKISKVYQIDYESFNKLRSVKARQAPLLAPHDAGTLPAHTSSSATVPHALKPGEAELWQINQFLQAEQARTDANSTIHAQIRCDDSCGNKKTIRLYIRSKAESCNDSLIDRFKYGYEQLQAAVLFTTLGRAYRNASTSPQACHTKNDSVERLINWVISPNMESITSWTQALALSIENDRFQKNSEQRDQHKKMLSIVSNSLQPRSPGEETITSESATKELKKYGFKSSEVTAFHKLVDNLVDGEKTDEEHEYQIHNFWMRWVGICERETNNFGKDFRRLICGSSELQRWNIVAHHLANRMEPKFDLRSYAGFDRVMVPNVEEMIWPEVIEAKDKGETHALVTKMHEDAYRNRGIEIKRFGFQKLVAAESCVISAEQTQLTPQQRAFLKRSYATSAGFEDSCLLTPLFNYTDNTIDQCIAIMIGPFKGALEKGQPLPRVGIFSSDSRISKKFNEAMEKLATTGRKKDNAAPGKSVNTCGTSHSVTEAADSAQASPPRSFLENVFDFAVHHGENISRKITAGSFTQPASTQPIFVPPTISSPTIPDRKSENETSNRELERETFEIKDDEPFDVSDQQKIADYRAATISRELAEKFSVISAQPRKKRNARIVDIAPPIKQISRVVAIDEPTPQKSSKLVLQLGIERTDWEPDQPTAVMLTDSAANCLQPHQMDIKPELDDILNSEIFLELKESGRILRPASSRFGSNEKSHIIPAIEIPLDISNWFSGSSKLDDTKASDIIRIYTEACQNAEHWEIRKLVLAPCFSFTSGQIFTGNNAYREAIAIMVKTLENLSAVYPGFHIKMIARSEEERMLMQEASQNQAVPG